MQEPKLGEHLGSLATSLSRASPWGLERTTPGSVTKQNAPFCGSCTTLHAHIRCSYISLPEQIYLD